MDEVYYGGKLQDRRHFDSSSGVFYCAYGTSGRSYAASRPIPRLGARDVATITVAGDSYIFAIALSVGKDLNANVLRYNNNHHAAFFYSSVHGRVNTDSDHTSHAVAAGAFSATLTLRGNDMYGTASVAVNGVRQDGEWSLPACECCYLLLATDSGPGDHIFVKSVQLDVL
jgi:hypothetical protein